MAENPAESVQVVIVLVVLDVVEELVLLRQRGNSTLEGWPP
jgi:hypothetical protein